MSRRNSHAAKARRRAERELCALVPGCRRPWEFTAYRLDGTTVRACDEHAWQAMREDPEGTEFTRFSGRWHSEGP